MAGGEHPQGSGLPSAIDATARRRAWGFTLLTWVGLGLWVVAQALPAWDWSSPNCILGGTIFQPEIGPCSGSDIGLALTLLGWMYLLGPLFPGADSLDERLAELVLGVAWSVNNWLVLALITRFLWFRRSATVLAVLAIPAGVVAILMIAGVVGDLHHERDIVSVGIGTWVWLASIAVLVVAIIGWARVVRAFPPLDD
jgi:hypothetical protein